MTLNNRVFSSSTIGFFSLYVFNQVCFQFCCTHFDLVSSQPPDLFRAQFHEIIHENTNIGFRFGFHSTHLDLVSFLSRQGLIVSQIWLSWPGARIENKTINILYSGHLFKKIETDTHAQSICTHYSSLSGRPDMFLGSENFKKVKNMGCKKQGAKNRVIVIQKEKKQPDFRVTN